MVKRDDVLILQQLVGSLEEAGTEIEKSFARNDLRRVQDLKGFILQINERIQKILNGA